MTSRDASSARRSRCELSAPKVCSSTVLYLCPEGDCGSDRRFDGAVNQQIGIAADRRGEMRVLFERQSEMADVGLLIHRLRQGTNDQTFEQRAIRSCRQPIHQLPKFPRTRALGKLCPDLQGVHHLLQLRDPLLLRLAVHAVQTAGLGKPQRRRRLDIGGDHAFLDQAMRIIAGHCIEALESYRRLRCAP